MRNVLFLDDDRSRIVSFVARLERYAVRVETVETADACVALLASEVWDLVLLDHDLGGEVFVDSARGDTGAEVTRWLRSHVAPHGAFIVHSMNPVGAAGMFFDLKDLGYRVTQAAFGSSEFWAAIDRELGLRTAHREGSGGLFARLGRYLRSIRRGRTR